MWWNIAIYKDEEICSPIKVNSLLECIVFFIYPTNCGKVEVSLTIKSIIYYLKLFGQKSRGWFESNCLLNWRKKALGQPEISEIFVASFITLFFPLLYWYFPSISHQKIFIVKLKNNVTPKFVELFAVI